MNTTSYTLKVEEDPKTGDAIIQFSNEFLEQVGWKEGDVINWEDQGDGSYVLTKVLPKSIGD